MGRLIHIYKRRRLLNALVKGWRTRKIMTQTREFLAVRRDLGETISQQNHWQRQLKIPSQY